MRTAKLFNLCLRTTIMISIFSSAAFAGFFSSEKAAPSVCARNFQEFQSIKDKMPLVVRNMSQETEDTRAVNSLKFISPDSASVKAAFELWFDGTYFRGISYSFVGNSQFYSQYICYNGKTFSMVLGDGAKYELEASPTSTTVTTKVFFKTFTLGAVQNAQYKAKLIQMKLYDQASKIP